MKACTKCRVEYSLDDFPPGVVPQVAKQIADLTKTIAEVEPSKSEPSDVDDFADAFNAAIDE